jgi:hypothetical protein
MMIKGRNCKRTSTDDRNEILVENDLEKQRIDFTREVNFGKA